MKLSIQGLSDIIREEEHSGISLRNMVIGNMNSSSLVINYGALTTVSSQFENSVH